MLSNFLKFSIIGLIVLLHVGHSYSQCNALRSQIDITFNTDQDCAPTTVTDFTIKYFFNVAQNPNDIIIRFRWNDPTNAITNVDIFSGLVASVGDTEFEATGTFLYPVNNDCSFLPTSYIVIAGVECPTSAQEQTAFSWARDNEFGGTLAITPPVYEVCHGDAIVNALFTDTSTFNCNPIDEPDNPNRQMRHVQFVYGTNHPGASIRDLTLNDGAVQTLTDAAGALTMSTTQGTAGLMITGAYFGPIDAIAFPADAPTSVSFPMSAPANVLNLVGNTFEVTMFNWNICNPYNDDPANPNYDESRSITAVIQIVAAPTPNFQTREVNAGGTITTDFCIGDVIYYDNLTGGGLDYVWEYYDGPLDTDPLQGSSTAINPTNAFTTGGPKLIRLIATNPTAQSACIVSFDQIINVTPTLIAQIRVTDLTDVDITPHFCQDAAVSQIFDVRFYDVAPGTPTVDTGRRWEFYNESGGLISSVPAGVGYVPGVGLVNAPDQTYSTPGNYEVKFLTRDNLTGCETEQSIFVRIFNDPVSAFTATEVCDGVDTHFENTSTLSAINGESIITYEWDFSYDGITFTKEATFDGMTVFDHNLGAANTYTVALRVVTDQNSCESIIAQTVEVRPLPISSFTTNVINGCSVLSVEFTNTADAIQTSTIDQYIWQIDPEQDGTFIDELVQDPTDPGFSILVTLDFANTTLLDRLVDVRLVTVNEFNCQTISAEQTITIFPAPQSGFVDLNYDPFSNNCGMVSVDFEVDAITQGLPGLTQYTWEVRDELGALVAAPIVKIPPDGAFTFLFVNSTTSDVLDFDVTLNTSFVGGCPSDSTRTIRVNPIPSALFQIDTLLLSCEEMTLQMSSIQKGLMNYQWEVFINGSSVFSSSAVGDVFDRTFIRPNSGLAALDVDIQLQTTNFANCQSSLEQQTLDVLSRDDINSGFSPTPLVQDEPNMTVTLNNTTNAGAWTYLWDFGDGNTSNDPNEVTHTFGVFGDYLITLTVSSEFCVEMSSQLVVINPAVPLLDFGFTADGGCLPAVVQFTNLSTFSDPSSYAWDFGDGNTSSGVVDPIHVYTTPGTYSVTLMADNGQGDDTTIVQNGIIVVYEPIAAFMGNEAFLDNCGSMSVDFEADLIVQNTPGLIQYTWSVLDDDGNNLFTTTKPPSDPQFDFEFINTSNTDVKDFEVQLTTDFDGNCSADSIRMIQVSPIPSALFDIDTLLIDCQKMTLQMNAIQPGLITYQWEVLIDGFSVYNSTTDGATLSRTFSRPAASDLGLSVDIRLLSTNVFNCQSTLEQQTLDILSRDDINSGFSPTPLGQDEPNMTVTLNNTTNAGAWAYLWDFGDGNTSIDPNEASHTYDTFGDYLITLTVSSDFCVETSSQLVVINPAVPLLDFGFTADGGCIPAVVQFTNLSTFTDPASYTWDFGDGNTSSGVVNPIHVYTTPGTYSVTLMADNGQGDDATIVQNAIVVVYEPSAAFMGNEAFLDNCGSMSVNFEADVIVQNTPGLIQYTWRVLDDDGNNILTTTKLPADPQFNFEFINTSNTDVKEFDVQLTTDFEGNCSADSIRTIQVNPVPSALFDIDTLLIDCQKMTLQMNAVQQGLTTYQWEVLIDGSSVYSSSTDGATLNRTFTRPIASNTGLSLDVRLLTTNVFNCQSVPEQQNVEVVAQEGINVGFSPTPLEQNQPGMTVTLNNTTAVGSWTYLWDFGDGQTSTDPNQASHTYANFGDFVITLTVTSIYCQEVAVNSVKINPTIPVLNFDFLPDNGCAPLRVDFTNLSQFADPSSYLWDFGDGVTLSGVINPTHFYTAPGLYNVKLTADNGAGDQATTVKEGIIEVYAAPGAIFIVRPEIVVLPGQILTNNGSFGATSFIWDFGDGNTSTDFEPVHEYSDVLEDDEGNLLGYDITLIAITENGCRDTTIINNAVIARRATEVLLPNAFSPSLTGPSPDGSVSDDDFTNDVFLPKMNLQRIKTFRMLIYNKWGELLFESNNKNKGWDGYYNGSLVQQDVYVYRLSLTYDDGQSETFVGDVTLVR